MLYLLLFLPLSPLLAVGLALVLLWSLLFTAGAYAALAFYPLTRRRG